MNVLKIISGRSLVLLKIYILFRTNKQKSKQTNKQKMPQPLNDKQVVPLTANLIEHAF